MATSSLKSVSGPERYQVSSVDDILRIPDMRTVRDLMKEWNIDTRGVKSKDEGIRRLIDTWKNNPKNVQKQRDNGFKQALLDDKSNRRFLGEKYDEVIAHYKRLPEQHQRDLDQFFKGIVEAVKHKKGQLTSSDCAILVAGETSAGKSSFINLLLGTDLLPTSDLQCTNTICEIRYSRDGRKYAVLHHRSIDSQKRKPERIDLERDNGIDTLARVITQLDEETDESPFSRVEIFWPIDVLDSGIVIVDTPGIGASRQLSKSVERFLSKSFGFIYIINSANAGGVQRGRLKDFLSLVTTSVDEEFNSRATMFICNKWDTVPESDREDVYNNTILQLKRCYNAVRVDQIYRLSTSEAIKAMMYADSTTAEHDMVLKGLERLLPNSLKNQISSHYGWISQVLKRSHYSLKVAKLMDAKGLEEKEQLQKKLVQQMDRLDRDAKYSLDSMRREIKEERENLSANIERLFSSTDVQVRICQWDGSQCPPTENWKKVVKEAESSIAKRIANEINLWDDQNRIVKQLKDKIVKKFKRDFQIMEDQMRDVEVVLLPGDKRAVSDFHKSMKRPAPVKNVFQKAGKKQGVEHTDDLKRIGGAVACAGSLNTKSKDVRSIFRSYSKRDATRIMADASMIFIHSITQGNALKSKLDLFLGKYMKGIDDITKMIPDLIKADRILLDNLKVEVKENKGLLSNLYPELLRNISKAQGQLDMFYVRCIMESDYRLRELDIDRAKSLGSGTFADVYMGHLRPAGQAETKVAVKINKQKINVSNVSDLLLEDRTLRDLKHKNIVTYYGSVLSQNEKSQIEWIMIMEVCKGTLKHVFLDDHYANPGKCDNRQKQTHAMREMARYVVELCNGLRYLHGKDLVHRDLKLENVLVSKEGTIKLTDVGLTKGADMISGTLVGSPVYMAPEVLLTRDIYDHKADIYSLGIMLWEMWYGIDAADHIRHYIHISLEDSVQKGLRPDMSIPHRPPDDWRDVIIRCWDKDPAVRLEAANVGHFFERV